VEIRPFTADDEAAAALLDRELGGRRQARLGEIHDVLALPGLGAWVGDELVGLVTYDVRGSRAELAALAVAGAHRGEGIGAALVEAMVDVVGRKAVDQVWLVTTNDNLEALRLYQRHAFRLAELHAGAVDRARELKPSIPLLGDHGIPMHDELVLVRRLRASRL
jgi:ribosomal protein S18 acetylase RimI-like enzyme